MKKHLLLYPLLFNFVFLSTIKLDAQCSVALSGNFPYLDCNNLSLDITAFPSTNNGPSTFEWSTGQLSPSITVTSAGQYSVTTTDQVGCTAVESYFVEDYSYGHIVDILASPDGIYCPGESVLLQAIIINGGIGPFDYFWNTGDTGDILFTSIPGYYEVQAYDLATGCISFMGYNVIEYSTPMNAVITSTISEITCIDPVTVLDANNTTGGSGPNYTYQWSTNETTSSIIVDYGGTFEVTVTDEVGCTAYANYTLTEATQAPFSTINASSSIDCNNPIVTLDGSGSFSFNGVLTYLWSTGETTPSINISAPGTYSLEVIDEGGCSGISYIPVTENIIEPVATITASSTEINNQNSSVTLDASGSTGQGSLLYFWSTGAVTSSITVSAAGLYEVIVIDDSNGCEATASIIITESLNDLYVDETATGNNDGSSWQDAFTDLQDAIAVGMNGTIHVAEGTYYPTSGSIRGIAFEIPDAATILGGYPSGGGTRNPASYETILSGNIDGVASYSGNSYHVVSVKNVNNVILDGLIVRDGNADNANSFGRSRGGGLFVNNATVTLANVEVKWNKAIYGAGLFATLSPNVEIVDCTFKKNTANNGSAIYHSNQTNLYVDRTRIFNNTSLQRCAIEVNNSLYTRIDNSVIANNASQNANAIAFIATNRDGSCDIYNTTILGETKNRFLITMQVGFGDQLDLSLYNSIIGHQVPTYLNAFKDFNNGVLNLNTTNCYVMGSSVIGNATNNLYSSLDGDLILDADYSLNPCSSGVDAGDNSSASGSTDIDGVVRVIGTVDMGAYENTGVCRLAGNDVETLNLETVSIFPNPTKNTINIQTSIENPSFGLFDLVGKQILTTNENVINITTLPQGIYLLRIMKGKELIEIIKIVKE